MPHVCKFKTPARGFTDSACTPQKRGEEQVQSVPCNYN